jgi:hypothetical protein
MLTLVTSQQPYLSNLWRKGGGWSCSGQVWAGIDSKKQHIGSSFILVVMERHNGEAKLCFTFKTFWHSIPCIPWEATSFLTIQARTQMR